MGEYIATTEHGTHTGSITDFSENIPTAPIIPRVCPSPTCVSTLPIPSIMPERSPLPTLVKILAPQA